MYLRSARFTISCLSVTLARTTFPPSAHMDTPVLLIQYWRSSINQCLYIRQHILLIIIPYRVLLYFPLLGVLGILLPLAFLGSHRTGTMPSQQLSRLGSPHDQRGNWMITPHLRRDITQCSMHINS
jgi:hypothetical protein